MKLSPNKHLFHWHFENLMAIFVYYGHRKQRPTRQPAQGQKDGIWYIDQKALIQWI